MAKRTYVNTLLQIASGFTWMLFGMITAFGIAAILAWNERYLYAALFCLLMQEVVSYNVRLVGERMAIRGQRSAHESTEVQPKG